MIDHTGTTSRIDRRPELQERLRDSSARHGATNNLCHEAADRIDQLEAALAVAKDALGGMLIWDRARRYITPYHVRDPINEALAKINELGVE